MKAPATACPAFQNKSRGFRETNWKHKKPDLLHPKPDKLRPMWTHFFYIRMIRDLIFSNVMLWFCWTDSADLLWTRVWGLSSRMFWTGSFWALELHVSCSTLQKTNLKKVKRTLCFQEIILRHNKRAFACSLCFLLILLLNIEKKTVFKSQWDLPG